MVDQDGKIAGQMHRRCTVSQIDGEYAALARPAHSDRFERACIHGRRIEGEAGDRSLRARTGNLQDQRQRA
jgi:hypothetical protein